MTPEEHERAAADLLRAEIQRTQIPLLTKQYPDMTMDDAYEIQRPSIGQSLSRGKR